MKKQQFFIVLLCLLFSIKSFSQDGIKNESICHYTTPIWAKPNTVLAIPCIWAKQDPARGEIMRFNYKNELKRIMLTASLAITEVPTNMSDIEASTLTEDYGLKKLSEGAGKFVSSGKIKIDGQQGGVIIRSSNEDGIYFYAIQNYFVYKRRIILIQYTMISRDRFILKKYIPYFKSLITDTKFK